VRLIFLILDCIDLLSQLESTLVISIRRGEINDVAHALVGVARNVGSRDWSNLFSSIVFVKLV
jgi:hypothetical protein